MRRLLVAACSASSTFFAAVAPAASLEGRIVDLTHPFDARTVYWPTEPMKIAGGSGAPLHVVAVLHERAVARK